VEKAKLVARLGFVAILVLSSYIWRLEGKRAADKWWTAHPIVIQPQTIEIRGREVYIDGDKEYDAVMRGWIIESPTGTAPGPCVFLSSEKKVLLENILMVPGKSCRLEPISLMPTSTPAWFSFHDEVPSFDGWHGAHLGKCPEGWKEYGHRFYQNGFEYLNCREPKRR